MQETILKLVTELPGQTFVSLSRQVPGFAGDRFIAAPGLPNLILWDSVSREAIEALGALRRAKTCHYKVTSDVRYQHEGRTLDLERAQGLRRYTDRRWLPVTLHPGSE